MSLRFDPVAGKIFPVFVYYAVPSIAGVLAMSCAVIIDGYFLGNHAGTAALAAVNMTIPVAGLLFGIALMLSVGGAARCGKFLGSGNLPAASATFSQSIVFMALIALLITVTGLMGIDTLVRMLGASGSLATTMTEYLSIILLFTIVQMGMVGLAYFVRVDGYPILAAAAMVLGSLLNVGLDWLFVAQLHLGHQGAALGTGLSETTTCLLLAAPFLLKKTRLTFNWHKEDCVEIIKAARNGFSEFSNEMSGGILIFIFNWILMHRLGENAVAAFSVINYIILGGLLISYGISDTLQPMISKNFGAGHHKRITAFLAIATVMVFGVGLAVSLLLILTPATLIDLFIGTGDKRTTTLALQFVAKIWPIFLLNGVNVVLSSYLTAMHRAWPSTIIALARSLFLPVLLLGLIPLVSNHKGIFIVLPLAEFGTFLIALVLLYRNSPAKLLTRHRHRPAAA